jgi:hypothetical protein
MISYLELAFAWLLFLSMPALATGMLYRAWKSGAAQETPDRSPASTGPALSLFSKRHWSYFGTINLTCGLALYAVFIAVVLYGLAFATWSGLTGLIVWFYCLALHIYKRRNANRALPV